MNKIAIYTAITGGKDRLRDPLITVPGVDYICYTDEAKLRSSVWDIRRIKVGELGPCLTAKEYKVFPHKFLKDYDISIWIDGSLTPARNFMPLLKSLLIGRCLAFFSHPWRDCLYAEGQACIEQGRCQRAKMLSQTNYYHSEDMPANWGLVRGGVIFRRHNDPALRPAMACWWDQLCQWTSRDQVSFPYAAWKTKTKYGVAPAGLFELYFNQERHQVYSPVDDRHPDNIRREGGHKPGKLKIVRGSRYKLRRAKQARKRR